MDWGLLKRLTEAHGIAGREDAIREIAKTELKDVCDLEADRMGNLIGCKRTDYDADLEPLKVMVAAHMDEIGFIVKYVDDKGFLRLNAVGGWDPRQMCSQRVIVHTHEGPLKGVLMPGVKPTHLLTDAERGKSLKVEDFFVDLGLGVTAVKNAVRLGDMVTMDRGFQETGDLMTCKAMDDRVCLFTLIEATKALSDHRCDVYSVATVQEEVGLRGARAAAHTIKPDVCIALDITLANDIPGVPDVDAVTRLGEGVAIKVMDSSMISHAKLLDHMRMVAESTDVTHQFEVLPRGGTDAGAIQTAAGPVPSITLSIPTRYVHTVNETVHKEDVKSCIDLLVHYLKDAHHGDYSY